MAVSIKTTQFTDNNKKKLTDVHHVSVNNSNKKGAAAAFGGNVILNVDKRGMETGWFIDLETIVNNQRRLVIVQAGDIVFRTNTNNRWQVLSKPSFNKRFSVVK